MVWFILGLFITIICLFKIEKIGECAIFLLLIGVAMSLAPVVIGISQYPELISLRESAISLRSEIKTIQNARYNSDSGILVGGSLDNIKQSTVLSEYIKDYAYKKAEYNRQLMSIKTCKKILYYNLFSNTWVIDNRVNELERIE